MQNGESRVKYKTRTLEKEILRASERFKSVMVSGMRQVGKSTMFQHLCADGRTHVTLEDFEAEELARNARNLFFKQFPAPVLIDEIPRVPELFLEVKVLVDSSDKRGQVWLTGTQRFSMMKNVSESLAGRLACFELLPLSLYEQQNKAFDAKPYIPTGELSRGSLSPKTPEETWRIIWQGCWPEVAEDTPKNRNIFFQSLLQTYIERDVILTGIRNLSDFRKFLTVLASRIGQEFQLNAVAAEVGVATQTAKQWLSIAESSGIIYLLPPFFENVGKTVIKRPKLFFTDTGFAAWLCKIPSPEALSKVYNNGSFFENFVVMELLKSWIHNGEEPYFYYYRDTRFNEIDLLIFDGTHYHPIEIKTSDSPQAGMIKAFDCIKGNTVKRGSGALICLTPKARYLSSDVVAHSIWDI